MSSSSSLIILNGLRCQPFLFLPLVLVWLTSPTFSCQPIFCYTLGPIPFHRCHPPLEHQMLVSSIQYGTRTQILLVSMHPTLDQALPYSPVSLPSSSFFRPSACQRLSPPINIPCQLQCIAYFQSHFWYSTIFLVSLSSVTLGWLTSCSALPVFTASLLLL